MVGAGVFGVLFRELALLLGALAGIQSGVGTLAIVLGPLLVAGMIGGAMAQESRTLECFLGGALAVVAMGILGGLPPYKLHLAGIVVVAIISSVVTGLGASIGRLLVRRT
jgi:hypothetical protein